MTIRYSVPTPEAISEVARRMSGADADEVRACSGNTPEQALLDSIDRSDMALVFEVNGTPEAIFGVATTPGFVGLASPWLLATEEFRRNPRAVMQHSRDWIKSLNDNYGTLFNMVDARHTRALRWLRWLGFVPLQLHPEYGVGRLPFYEMVRPYHV